MTVNQMAYTSSAYRNFNIHATQASKSMQKLSSGYRINSAADDAAGLAVSEKMRGQIGGLSKASENTQHAISMTQTAEGALDKSHAIITRMKELSVQAGNGTMSDSDRGLLDKEFQQLKGNLDQISSSTHYNGTKMLDGSFGGKKGDAGIRNMGVSNITTGGGNTLTGDIKFSISSESGVTSITAQIGDQTVTNDITNMLDTSSTFTFSGGNTVTMDFSATAGGLQDGVITNVGVAAGAAAANTVSAMSATGDAKMTFQVGANGGADQKISMGLGDMSSLALGLQNMDIKTVANANASLAAVDVARESITSTRSVLGATQNRFEHTLNNLGVSIENLTWSESTIRDVDIAKEMMNFTQRNMMMQASQAMMAQGMMNRSSMIAMLLR